MLKMEKYIVEGILTILVLVLRFVIGNNDKTIVALQQSIAELKSDIKETKEQVISIRKDMITRTDCELYRDRDRLDFKGSIDKLEEKTEALNDKCFEAIKARK